MVRSYPVTVATADTEWRYDAGSRHPTHLWLLAMDLMEVKGMLEDGAFPFVEVTLEHPDHPEAVTVNLWYASSRERGYLHRVLTDLIRVLLRRFNLLKYGGNSAYARGALNALRYM